MSNSRLKESNIEWLGKIPKNWKLMHNKYLLKKKKSIISKYNNEKILSLTMNGVIERDLTAGGKMPSSFNGYQKLEKGNLLLCLFDIDVTPRCVGIIPTNGITSPAYSQFILNKGKANLKYYYYYFLMLDNQKTLVHLSKNLRNTLSEQEFGNLISLCPPLKEQKQIADFLDKKVSQIDDISKKIQQEITDLEAYRKSVITKTITKGLNPNVPMKDSGIEWIGKIPTDWSVIRLKYLGSAGNGLTYSPQNMTDESGTLILRSSNIQHGEIVNADNVYVNSSVSKSLILKKDDLLICSRNGSKDLIGKNALINKEFIGSSFGAFMCVFRSKYNQYIYYVLNSNIFKFYVGSFLTSTINQLTKHNLYNLAFPFPQKENERKQIIAFLKEKCENINHLITHKKDQLKLLNQYKQSIIYEYVTGKKQVPTEEGAVE